MIIWCLQKLLLSGRFGLRLSVAALHFVMLLVAEGNVTSCWEVSRAFASSVAAPGTALPRIDVVYLPFVLMATVARTF